jgi:anti-sigma factor RsiW
MFDRCRAWRILITRRAEGLLSASERALLNEHIDKCAACRKVQAADEALAFNYFVPDAAMPPCGARQFDDAVVTTLRALPLRATPPVGWRERVRACSTSVSFEFCMQLAGGALAAAAVTAFAIVSALNPVPSSRTVSAFESRSITALERNEPPVPLESLLQSPAPRAAMLWAPPGRSPRRTPAAQSSNSPHGPIPRTGRNSAAPRRHGQRSRGFTMA